MMMVIDRTLLFLMLCAPYAVVFFGALAVSFFLTPILREFARKLGMVDAPSERRINKTAIPRGGGLAVFVATSLPVVVLYFFFSGSEFCQTMHQTAVFRLTALSGVLALVGLADDKFGLPPLVKLAAQAAVALGTHFFCGVGFAGMFPSIPPALDTAVTVFWIVGAVNAFNFIDGLDGLATGLAVIASAGMAGSLFFTGRPEATLCHFAFIGACLGFLRYNFNPASVFLGDTGSMFLGFFLSTTPLILGNSRSLFVSLGVPMLAMGVPIFDTSLAILRRTLRAFLFRENADETGNRHVMRPDTDHLHHRILRSFLSQRKAAFALYALAAFLVVIALGGIALKGRAVALYIVGFVVVAAVIFRDMRRIELWDAGRLLDSVAHDSKLVARRRRHVLSVPFYVVNDIAALFLAWLITALCMGYPVGASSMRRWMALRTIPTFIALVFFRAYVTSWSRALLSNYVRLAMAVALGALGTGFLVVVAGIPHTHFVQSTFLYSATAFVGLLVVRVARPALRDLFYALSSARLQGMPGVSRVLVYGAGLRYRSFRRELVRSAAASKRVIVGIIDDDILLRGQYIGGIKVYGTLEQAPDIIKSLKADAVVIACVLTPTRFEVARKIFAPCGVKVTLWVHEEREV